MTSKQAATNTTSGTQKKARMIFWVSPGNGFWKVKKEGSVGRSRQFPTKEAAEVFARELAQKNEPSQVKIQNLDGKIQTEWTYGNDPRDTPG